jgi:tyrosinase
MTEFTGSAAEAISQGCVSGLKTGKVELRLEIDEFVLDKDVLNLFLLALDQLQKKPWTDPWSWFQISGIHGRPHVNWDDVSFAKNPAWAGYCSHSSVTFPTWHRPYVAMMEVSQVISQPLSKYSSL